MVDNSMDNKFNEKGKKKYRERTKEGRLQLQLIFHIANIVQFVFVIDANLNYQLSCCVRGT